MFKRFLLICLLVFTVTFSACSKDIPIHEGNTTIQVSVSFDAMREFVYAVGKDNVSILTIVPTGIEPHDFEPKAKDLVALGEADIFIYNGLGMESWVQEAIDSANNPNLIVVEASSGADLISNSAYEEHSEYGQFDPHIWLSLKDAEVEVTNIKNALIEADSENKEFYESNAADFIAQLHILFDEYSEKFSSVPSKSFVTGHAAFGYLCRDFGLEQNSVEDIFAEGEPTAQQLIELVEYCKVNSVKTVFAEEMASPEISQTLANELGAKIETLYTIESAEDGLSYLERMSDNLSKIYSSLR